MAYRLPSERISITIEDGPTVEVERVSADLLYQNAVGLASAYLADDGGVAELRALYDFFVAEAQPTWEIVDHRGTLPATVAGMLRLPTKLALEIIEAWCDTIFPKETAVDKIIPASPLRDQLNAKLRAKRKAA